VPNIGVKRFLKHFIEREWLRLCDGSRIVRAIKGGRGPAFQLCGYRVPDPVCLGETGSAVPVPCLASPASRSGFGRPPFFQARKIIHNGGRSSALSAVMAANSSARGWRLAHAEHLFRAVHRSFVLIDGQRAAVL